MSAFAFGRVFVFVCVCSSLCLPFGQRLRGLNNNAMLCAMQPGNVCVRACSADWASVCSSVCCTIANDFVSHICSPITLNRCGAFPNGKYYLHILSCARFLNRRVSVRSNTQAHTNKTQTHTRSTPSTAGSGAVRLNLFMLIRYNCMLPAIRQVCEDIRTVYTCGPLSPVSPVAAVAKNGGERGWIYWRGSLRTRTMNL